MPISHAEAIKSTPGVQDVTWANWFGGIYKDPQNFFAQFAIDPESYLRMYPEILLTPEEQAGVPRGPHRLHRRRRPGEAVRLQGRRQDRRCRSASRSTARRTSTSPSAASTGPAARAVDNQSMLFHWKYADERSLAEGAGRLVRRARSPTPIRPPQVATAIDQKFANSPYETKTDTEQAVPELVRRRCSAT